MKVSGLELEIELKSADKFFKILMISKTTQSCCDVHSVEIDKYLVDLLEKNTNYNLFYAQVYPSSKYIDCSTNMTYVAKMDNLYKLLVRDKNFENKNLYSIEKTDLLGLHFEMNIDDFLRSNKIPLIESLKVDIKHLMNVKNELTTMSSDLFRMIFSENKNKTLNNFLLNSKEQCLIQLLSLVKQTESMINICEQFLKLENENISFLKGPEFGNVQVFYYNIDAADNFSLHFVRYLNARNYSNYTFGTFVQTLEFLVTIFSKKFENNIVLANEQFGFNIIYLLHTIFNFDIEYVSDKYNIEELSKKMKESARNDIYDVFTKHPKTLGCTYTKKN